MWKKNYSTVAVTCIFSLGLMLSFNVVAKADYFDGGDTTDVTSDPTTFDGNVTDTGCCVDAGSDSGVNQDYFQGDTSNFDASLFTDTSSDSSSDQTDTSSSDSDTSSSDYSIDTSSNTDLLDLSSSDTGYVNDSGNGFGNGDDSSSGDNSSNDNPTFSPVDTPPALTLCPGNTIPSPATACSFNLIPSMVRNGNQSRVYVDVEGLSPSDSCSITSAPYISGLPSWNGVGTSWTISSGYPVLITRKTIFTLTCSASDGATASVSKTVNLIPAVQEI